MSSGELHSDSVSRNAAFALATQLTTAAFTAVITVFLVRALDPAGYGLFALALGFAGLVALPADFGVSSSSARFIAERRGDPAAVAAVLVKALGLKLVLTSLASLALIALAEPIAALYDQPDLAWPLRAVSLALLGQNLVFLFASAFVAMGRVAWQFALVLCEAAIEATATLALVLVAGGATAAAFGRAIGFCCGALIGAAFMLRLLGRRAIARRRGGPRLRELAGYAGALMIVDGAYAIFTQSDVLLIGAILGATAAGVYAAPLKLTALLHYPGLSIANAIAPRVARHVDHPPDVGSLTTGLRLLIILQAAIAVVVVVWAEPIVSLVLGPGYSESTDVLRALGPFIFLSGLGPLATTSVNYLGEARRRVPIVAGCAVLHVGLTIALLELIGVTGAAFSLDLAYAIYVAVHLLICARLLDFSIRPLLGTAARTVPAAGALAIVLYGFGTEGLGPLQWVGGLALGTVAFVGTLIVVRETSRSELAALRRTIAGSLRRVAA